MIEHQESDHRLGIPQGWDSLTVARWRGRERLGEPFHYDLWLFGPPLSIAPEELLGAAATLGVACSDRDPRRLHGVITAAELVDQGADRDVLHVEVEPFLALAGLRRRCRTFVDASLESIVGTVLGNLPTGLDALLPSRLASGSDHGPLPALGGAFAVPMATYRWDIADPGRCRSPRRFVVQYNETDLAFVARLLEAEGITYFFEHHTTESVMVLSDDPGSAHRAPPLVRPLSHDWKASPDQELVRHFGPGRRLTPNRVSMRDFAWRKSRFTLHAAVQRQDADQPERDHFEYPARDEDEPRRPGHAPARYQLERFDAEAQIATGFGNVRGQEPGRRLRIEDPSGQREAIDVYLVAVEASANPHPLPLELLGAKREHASSDTDFSARFEALPLDVRFRPARKTPRPKIHGIQSAVVTAEEISLDAPPALHSDELGRVRLRFRWDQREPDGSPSSKWIRVAHHWAGVGYGAQFTPRVGHEVLVAFEDGDPDRPIVVGRVYNAQNPPPYAEPNTTITTLKSESVVVDGEEVEGFNELRFDDRAHEEQVFLHAQRNLDEVVRANHSTSVGGDQSNSVGGDQSNRVFGSRTHRVDGTELVSIGGPRTTELDATESHSVATHRVTGIGANDTIAIGADHSVNVGADERIEVGASRSLKVGDHQAVEIGADETWKVGGTRLVQIGADQGVHHGGRFTSSATVHTFRCDKFVVDAGGATLTMEAGTIVLDDGGGARIVLTGGTLFAHSADLVSLSGNHTLRSGGTVQLNAGARAAVTSGGSLDLRAGGPINAKGSPIKLND
ncbi:MAG: type VI secretion system tip protein VgrG [Myxococcales bacterium]|nr:type VI secretion system tip protein VgrG [Myxococcales bacterium]